MSDSSSPSLSFDRWFTNVVEVVSALANVDAQDAAWGQQSSSITFDSPDELMCIFFDDVIVPDFLDEHSRSLGDACVLHGKELTSLLERYQWPMSGAFIDATRLVAEHRWGEVRMVAKRFLDSLDSSVSR